MYVKLAPYQTTALKKLDEMERDIWIDPVSVVLSRFRKLTIISAASLVQLAALAKRIHYDGVR